MSSPRWIALVAVVALLAVLAWWMRPTASGPPPVVENPEAVPPSQRFIGPHLTVGFAFLSTGRDRFDPGFGFDLGVGIRLDRKVSVNLALAWGLTEFERTEKDRVRGVGITIPLQDGDQSVHVHYHTKRDARGLFWLKKTQTFGQQQPTVYSDNAGLQARSWLPIQDTGLVRSSKAYRNDQQQGADSKCKLQGKRCQQQVQAGRYAGFLM